jgi:vacuolar-type H+-ATPase subunit E/Vma4
MPYLSLCCRRLALPAALFSALLLGCEQKSSEEPDAPAPPAQGMQQQTEGETPGLPDAGDIARDAEAAAREAADEIRRTAEEAREQAQRQAEEQVEQTRQQAEQQVEEVSQAARETMEQYLGDLGALGDTLGGVTNQFNAAAASPQARTLVQGLEASMKQLEQLAPEQLARLKSIYAESLAPLVQKAQGEINRLTSDDSFAALRPILQDIPLLKP